MKQDFLKIYFHSVFFFIGYFVQAMSWKRKYLIWLSSRTLSLSKQGIDYVYYKSITFFIKQSGKY